jgi:guanylate kinase
METKIICLIGASGVGKTSYAMRLSRDFNYLLPDIVTTRKRRNDDDTRYFYVSEEEFNTKINHDEFLEYDKYTSYFYGTLRSSVIYAIDDRVDGVVLDLTPNGFVQVKRQFPDCIGIAIIPDNLEWPIRRLRERNTQSSHEMIAREEILRSYLASIDKIECHKVVAYFDSATWNDTFNQLVNIINI